MTTVADARSVLIVDDEPAFRTRIRELIASMLPSVLIGEAGSGSECLDRLADQTWDVVLLDICMPGRSGLSVLRDIKRLRGDVRVVMLSGLSQAEYGPHASRAGVCAYVEKARAADELVETIEPLLAGVNR